MDSVQGLDSIIPINALPIGTQLNEYVVRSVVGEGGFGIVYLAYDTLLEREVAIKEFLPANFATRFSNLQVGARSVDKQELFKKWQQRFVKEAHILAKFRHPALVSVLRFFSANGTAYMVMPYYRGKTLRDMIRSGYRATDIKSLLSILLPILTSLLQIHTVECYHLDVSTDNILILEDGSPVLLDFGSARYEQITSPQSATVVLKPGFAPIEQYGDGSELTIGPWTDIYATSAVAYQLVSGNIPVISVGRTMRDTLIPLANFATPELPVEVLNLIDRGLSVNPQARPQSVEEFIAELRSMVSRSYLPSEDDADTVIGGGSGRGWSEEKTAARIVSFMQTGWRRLNGAAANATSDVAGRLHVLGTGALGAGNRLRGLGMEGFGTVRRLCGLGMKRFLGLVSRLRGLGMEGFGAAGRLSGLGMKGLFGLVSRLRGLGIGGLGATGRLYSLGIKGLLGAAGRLRGLGMRGASTARRLHDQGGAVIVHWWGGKAFRVAVICITFPLIAAVVAYVLFSIMDSESLPTLPPTPPHVPSRPNVVVEPLPAPKPEPIVIPDPLPSPPPIPPIPTPPPEPGMIVVTVKPWGYVYLNGEIVGRAPPRVTLKNMSDGTHRIEIRNDSETVKKTVRVSKGQTVPVEHTFK